VYIIVHDDISGTDPLYLLITLLMWLCIDVN